MEWFESDVIGFLFDGNLGLKETGLGSGFGTIEGTFRMIDPGFGSRFFFFCFSASSSKSLSQLTYEQSNFTINIQNNFIIYNIKNDWQFISYKL